MDKEKNLYDVIILGTGPAGLQAAIYTSRAKLKTLVLGKKENSRLSRVPLISNYFGFEEGISGRDILERGIKQAEKSSALLKDEEAIEVTKNRHFFLVRTPKEEYLGRSILLATGAKDTSSGIKNEGNFLGLGISFCVACDGVYFANKRVGVLGEGDFAAKEALELLTYTNDVTLYSNGKNWNINEELKRELENSKVKFNKAKIKEFFGIEKLEGVITEDQTKTNFDGIFIAIGTPKASDFALKLGVKIFNNYIVVDDKGKTNKDGVFAAGDAIGSALQVGSAVGSAINAAFSIISYLNTKKGDHE